MKLEEKLEKAKSLYEKLGFNNFSLKTMRDDEISADFIWVENARGPGGIIIDDKGELLFCPSIKPFNFYKEEFKKGVRSKKL